MSLTLRSPPIDMYSCRPYMSPLNTSFLPCNLRFCELTFERHKYIRVGGIYFILHTPYSTMYSSVRVRSEC